MKKLNNFMGGFNVFVITAAISNILFLSNMKTNLPVTLPPDWMASAVAITIIAMGLMNLFSLLAIAIQFRYFKQASFLSSGTFVLGFFGLFVLAVGVVMLQDIGQEVKAGFDSAGEWNMVFFSHILQGIFGLAMLALVRRSAKLLNDNIEIPFIEKDEAVFLTVHQVGIFSAVLGFSCMLMLKLMDVPEGFLEGLYVFAAIVALIPYTVSALYWLVMKRKVKITEWYDEKQFMDISQGALITVGVSVLGMSMVFVLMVIEIIPNNMLFWFPVYLCGTLLVFSLSNQVISNR